MKSYLKSAEPLGKHPLTVVCEYIRHASSIIHSIAYSTNIDSFGVTFCSSSFLNSSWQLCLYHI